MFKNFFENKKVAIFDLETIITDIESLYILTFKRVLLGLKVDWIYVPDIVKGGRTLKEMWEEILKDPYMDTKIPLTQFLDNTYTELISVIDEADELDTKEGFWPFIDELQTTFGYKLILKSEMTEVITKALIKKLELDDVFDLVITQPTDKRKNLYTEILKILKENKLTNQECISFERHPSISKEASKNNILTVGIKDPGTISNNFTYKTDLFAENFEIFIGNIDKTYREAFLEAHPNIKKGIEKMIKNKETDVKK